MEYKDSCDESREMTDKELWELGKEIYESGRDINPRIRYLNLSPLGSKALNRYIISPD
jgi:hypothetical protein